MIFETDARRTSPIPPMGQGLALIAVLIGAALFAAIGVGAYMLSLRTAAARAEMSRLDGLADAGRAEIARLGRDYEVRSRLPELDRWRAPLALGPATAAQFVGDGDAIAPAAAARRRALAAADRAATPTYTKAARIRLDDLVAAVSG